MIKPEELHAILKNVAPVETASARNHNPEFDQCLAGACADLEKPSKVRGRNR